MISSNTKAVMDFLSKERKVNIDKIDDAKFLLGKFINQILHNSYGKPYVSQRGSEFSDNTVVLRWDITDNVALKKIGRITRMFAKASIYANKDKFVKKFDEITFKLMELDCDVIEDCYGPDKNIVILPFKVGGISSEHNYYRMYDCPSCNMVVFELEMYYKHL